MSNMYKLSALDAGFLYNETERSPQHIASVQVMELPAGMGADQFIHGLKTFLLKRIHLVPYLTNKVQTVPFGLDHPVWVRDRDFSIDNHVRTARVAAPGGRRQIDEKVAEIHSVLMDRSRPLWDLWVMTGLEDGRVAYYSRAHHSCLDGVAGQAATQTLMDATQVPAEVSPVPEGFFNGNTGQSAGAMFVGALENFAKFQIKQQSAWMTNLETAAKLFQRSLDSSKGLGAVAESAPTTRFNRPVQATRAYATGEIGLAEIKAMGKAGGATINDVFVAVCGGGLRRYLARVGELPEESLIAGCPVSLRGANDTGMDNKVTMMQVSMATHVADPKERLVRIVHSAAIAKGYTADMAEGYDPNVSLPGLPGLMSNGVRMMERSGLLDAADALAPFNVVVSNVPGPRETLYSNGAKMLTHYPVSIATHMQAVNITVQSYTGVLYFAVTACAKALSDPEVLVDDMLAAYEELKMLLLTGSTTVIRETRPQKKRAKARKSRPHVEKAA